MYNPESPSNRIILAQKIEDKLEECGFQIIPESLSGSEKIYYRTVKDGLQVRVYTTIVGNLVRTKDSDAIRVAGVYVSKDGNVRGLVSVPKVLRTGKMDDIVQRMYERMREVWPRLNNIPKCKKCDAPLFKSKRGNLVCAEICWKK